MNAIRHDAGGQVTVAGTSRVRIESADQALEVIGRATANRCARGVSGGGGEVEERGLKHKDKRAEGQGIRKLGIAGRGSPLFLPPSLSLTLPLTLSLTRTL